MNGGFALLLIAAIVVAIMLATRWRRVTIIYPPAVGLLYRDGRFVRELPPGRHVRFDPFGKTKVVRVPLAELPTPFGEVTVLSKDQFSFRIGLAPVVKVVDPRLYIEAHGAVEQQGTFGSPPHFSALHSILAAVALEVVAEKSLAAVLAERAQVPAAVQARIADVVPGALVESVLLTSINLPPETRKMFTDVERARMEAQASLERARGEQAALRALANAARLMTDNPALANLRLLQAVESAKSATIVLGSGAGVPNRGLADPASPA